MLSTGLPKLGKKHEKCDPRILSRLKPRAITVDMLPRSLAASIRRKPLPKDIPAPVRPQTTKSTELQQATCIGHAGHSVPQVLSRLKPRRPFRVASLLFRLKRVICQVPNKQTSNQGTEIETGNEMCADYL